MFLIGLLSALAIKAGQPERREGMRTWVVTGVVALMAWQGTAPAELEETTANELTAALDVLAAGNDDVSADRVLKRVRDAGYTPEDWHAFYETYFAGRAFTTGHAEFWQGEIHALQEREPLGAIALAQASGQFAAEALAAADDVEPRDIDSFDRALLWLANTGAWLGAGQVAPLRESLSMALQTRPLNIEAMLRASTPQARVSAMQACLTLGSFYPDGIGASKATLPEVTERFMQETGLWLFDNGALSPAHLASLTSLYAAVPRELHNVAVLLVPESIGLTATQAGLNAGGFVLDLAYLPMESTSDPSEFIPRVGYKAAPEFTLNAATQLMRVVQEVQFAARPQLAAWRNEILSRAGTHNEYYLRRHVPAQVYLSNPGELVPLTSYLWFLDSERAFFMAMEMMKVEVSEPLDAVLLLADTLSGGGGNTLVFSTNEAGVVSSTVTPIRRTALPNGAAVVSGMAMGGELWNFDMNVSGGVEEYYREH